MYPKVYYGALRVKQIYKRFRKINFNKNCIKWYIQLKLLKSVKIFGVEGDKGGRRQGLGEGEGEGGTGRRRYRVEGRGNRG